MQEKPTENSTSDIDQSGASPETTGNGSTDHAVYFLEVTVENARCFGSPQTLDLSNKNGRPAQWTVILGDNGTGKTTLLKCIAAFSTRVASAPLPIGEVLRFDHEAHLGLARHDAEQHMELKARLQQGSSLAAQTSKCIAQELVMSAKESGSLLSTIQRNSDWCRLSPEGGCVTCYGYGASRRMGITSLSEYELGSSYASLFDDNATLINAEEWLLLADYASVSESKINARAQEQRALVADLLLKLLPDVSKMEVQWSPGTTPRPAVFFGTPYGMAHINNLGLGYKTLIAWMVDFAWRLFQRYPESPNPLAEPAIVLVDEIDLHLHPKWQRTIMSFLTERFPNTQFIVTAHSPLVVQAAENANIVLLRREGDQVTIDNDIETVRGWRADQILTSELFGLASSRPPQYEGIEQKRLELLAKSDLTPQEKGELRTLEEEVTTWPTADRSDDIEAMDIIRRAAAHLKARKG